MGNIFGREAEASPAPPERCPAVVATRQPLHYRETFALEDTFQNQCFRGTACRFSHAGITNTTTGNIRKPCRFFTRGHCRRGDACNFSHDRSLVQDSTDTSKDDECTEGWAREFGGAWAKFGDGAAIVDVSLPSDFSAIEIRNLPISSSANFVRTLLSDVGMTVSMSDIRYIKTKVMPNAVAIVKVKDPAFATTACSRLQTVIEPPDLIVNSIRVPVPAGFQFGQVDNRQ
ncbi:hypothetical protein NXS19_012977, partial [Fusarium pseudograminearum]